MLSEMLSAALAYDSASSSWPLFAYTRDAVVSALLRNGAGVAFG